MTYNRTMTATTYVVDVNKKKVLLHLHKKFGKLYPLGGHIEADELPHEAAIREVLEESGLKVTLVDCTDIPINVSYRLISPFCLLHENTDKPVQNIDFVYIAGLPEGISEDMPLSPDLEGESRQFFWLSEQDIKDGRTDVPEHIKPIAIAVLHKMCS